MPVSQCAKQVSVQPHELEVRKGEVFFHAMKYFDVKKLMWKETS